MEMKTIRHGDVEVLSVRGSLDVMTSDQLDQKLNEIIDAGQTKLIIELGGLDYVSSAGLRVVMLLLKKIKSVNGVVVFCAFTKQVRQIFDIAGLSFRIDHFDTLEKALQHFPGASSR